MDSKKIKLAFFSNQLNLHQVYLADAFYKILGERYVFVEVNLQNVTSQKGGGVYNRPYLCRAKEGKEQSQKAIKITCEAEICIFGACSQEYAIMRAKHNPKGLSFEVAERWLKRGWLNILSPNLIRWWVNYRLHYRKANFYKLCSSAYVKEDDEKLGAYKGRHYKWGYFPEAKSYVGTPKEEMKIKMQQSSKILWCARFLELKHPEVMVLLAEKLVRTGVDFHIDMIGDGDTLEKTKQLAHSKGVANYITFVGALPNSEVIREMYLHDVFVMSSDKHEGWGVVVNEAMQNECCVIASNQVGSAPYLIRDGENGLLFSLKDEDSLYNKVMYALSSPDKMREMAIEGKKTIMNIWNPTVAAKAFLKLAENLWRGENEIIIQGPCSKA